MSEFTAIFSRQSDEWSTPQDLFETLDEEFSFDLDAAASCENAKCDDYFHHNSLDEDWYTYGLSVFLNPPYSQCRQFLAKAAGEAGRGCTVVCLVPSRTDTRWWHETVWDVDLHQPRPGVEIRYIKGRLKFGDGAGTAPFPSALIIMRPRRDA
jgi:phage N-6-adenine-methyltransferase